MQNEIDFKITDTSNLITDKGWKPEMRIWLIFLIESNLKWCIYIVHLVSRSLFSYFWKGTEVNHTPARFF